MRKREFISIVLGLFSFGLLLIEADPKLIQTDLRGWGLVLIVVGTVMTLFGAIFSIIPKKPKTIEPNVQQPKAEAPKAAKPQPSAPPPAGHDTARQTPRWNAKPLADAYKGQVGNPNQKARP